MKSSANHKEHAVQTISRPPCDPRQNHFLADLPDSVWTRWRGQLELLDLPLDKQLYPSGGRHAHVYFPTTAVVSLMYFTRDGASTEICAVGNDGVIGFDSLMGEATTHNLAVVQSAGYGYCLPAQAVRQELALGGPAVPLLLRYAHSQAAQAAQTAVCNHFHSIEQKVCRRLLTCLDRTAQCEVALTHEQFSHLLGVRRESITAAAHNLQRCGAIRYSRGHITVLDRQRLEQGACECYAAGRRQCAHTKPMLIAA
jgi:hypothetical protein